MTTTNAAGKTRQASTAATTSQATSATPPDDGKKAGKAKAKGSSPVDRINAKALAVGAFARRWETVFGDAIASAKDDIARARVQAAANAFTKLVAGADAASTALLALKNAGWKAPRPRGKSDHRVNDVVDVKRTRAEALIKTGRFTKTDLVGLQVTNVLGKYVEVGASQGPDGTITGKFEGVYPGYWFGRQD